MKHIPLIEKKSKHKRNQNHFRIHTFYIYVNFDEIVQLAYFSLSLSNKTNKNRLLRASSQNCKEFKLMMHIE